MRPITRRLRHTVLGGEQLTGADEDGTGLYIVLAENYAERDGKIFIRYYVGVGLDKKPSRPSIALSLEQAKRAQRILGELIDEATKRGLT